MPKPTDDTIWIQVKATKDEAEELTRYAEERGYTGRSGGRSAWMADLALGTGREGTDGTLTINGDVAREVGTAAQAEGLTVQAWLRRALGLTAVFQHGTEAAATRSGDVPT